MGGWKACQRAVAISREPVGRAVAECEKAEPVSQLGPIPDGDLPNNDESVLHRWNPQGGSSSNQMGVTNPIGVQNPLHRGAVVLGDLDKCLAALHAVMDDLCLGRLALLRLSRCDSSWRWSGRLIVHLSHFHDWFNCPVGW